MLPANTWTTLWGAIAAAAQAAQLAPLGKYGWIAQLVGAFAIGALGKQAAGVKK